MKANITLSLDLETIQTIDEIKERTGINRSKMIRGLFTFFKQSPDQFDKIMKWYQKRGK